MSHAVNDSSYSAVVLSPDDAAAPCRLERGGRVREVGEEAVWEVSSCKTEHGVDNLRDNSLDTFWQSDGRQPHLVNILFHRKTAIEVIYIYLDYQQDESYTPDRISVRVGSPFGDLRELVRFSLEQPSGWVRIPTRDTAGRPVRTFFLQIAVLSNHQSGRDTHLRQIKLYSPVHQSDVSVLRNVRFTSPECRMYSCIR